MISNLSKKRLRKRFDGKQNYDSTDLAVCQCRLDAIRAKQQNLKAQNFSIFLKNTY